MTSGIKLTENELKIFAKNCGYTLLSNYFEYKNYQSKLIFKCKNGHNISIALNYLNKSKCKFCLEIIKNNKLLQECKNFATKNNGLLISNIFINKTSPLNWECEVGHKFTKSLLNIRQGTFCNLCKNRWTNEEICREIFQFIFNKNFPKYRDKNRLGRYEFDGYCEELGIAFEHHGEQHYKLINFFNKRYSLEQIQKNDKYKLKLAKKLGIKIIIIPHIGILTKKIDLKEKILKDLILLNISIPEQIYNLDLNIIYNNLSLINNHSKEYYNKCLEYAKQKNGKLLSINFINSTTKLEWECHNGHKFLLNWNSIINKKYWCNQCYHDSKLKSKKSRNEIEKLLTKDFLINEYFNKKIGLNKFSEKFGLSASLIRNKIKELGFKLKEPSIYKNIDVEKIKYELIVNNKNLKQISKEFNISITTIKKRLNELGKSISSIKSEK